MILPAVRRTIIEYFGEAGHSWLDSAPLVIAALARRHSLRIGHAFSGGTASIVLEVTQSNGQSAILKLPFVDEENRAESDALHLYDGDGAALLYDFDPESGAMMIERLTPGDSLLDHDDEGEAIDIACALLARLRRPVPAGHPFPFVRDAALRWADRIPRIHLEYKSPFSGDLIRAATEAAQRFADDPEVAMLVNRDAHLGNILSAEREPWLLIDPKPLVGEPAFDGGYLLLDRLGRNPTPQRARALATRIAKGLRVEPERVSNWAFLRAMENGVWAVEAGASAQDDIAKATATRNAF